MRYPTLFLVVGLSLLLAACSFSASTPATSPAPKADFAGLHADWNTIEPTGDTLCSDGSAYKFYVRQGDPEKLMFYLEGGGACWTGALCDADLQATYTVNLQRSDPARFSGVFDFERADNPFADYTVIMAPYCSGDVHLGDISKFYQSPSVGDHSGHALRIEHRGYNNAQAALRWVYEHLFQPETVFVTGSSAGSIPSPFYAVELARHYPQSRIVQLGDASGGYNTMASFTPYESWNLDTVLNRTGLLAGVVQEEFNFQLLYEAAAKASAGISFASYDTAEDAVQKQFLALGGSPVESLQTQLDDNLRVISSAVPKFRYFVAGGSVHTVLLSPNFYKYKVGETLLMDWIGRLARGESVQNQHCVDCTIAEIVN
ncbi:MAG: hypothetical protein COC19_04785 [SAR86 cluster bacterium]|uniref:Pectinacetylesterase n=1 Tax=SAR86 cluster bacterium TaxID=2030880 RepID=A0A2A4MN34_9GAMM|nr:MAG: hypothetical protein COC19_04785 [SAR86 cluster bacterium]